MKYREKRRQTKQDITIMTRRGARCVSLQDIHTDGALVNLPRGFELWADMDVELCYRDNRYPAKVAWSRSGCAGLTFAAPLRPSTVTALLRDGDKPPIPGAGPAAQ